MQMIYPLMVSSFLLLGMMGAGPYILPGSGGSALGVMLYQLPRNVHNDEMVSSESHGNVRNILDNRRYASYWNAYLFLTMFTQQGRPLPSLATTKRESSQINSFTQLKTRNHSSRCFIMNNFEHIWSGSLYNLNKFEHVMGAGRKWAGCEIPCLRWQAGPVESPSMVRSNAS